MSESIIVALIGAGGVIVAAIIGALAKKKSSSGVFIRQKQKGNQNKQIGNSTIINNKGKNK